METHIKESLALLLDGISRSDGPVVTREMTRLDEMLERDREGLPPQLAHFLERRSYAKALAFLGGEIPAVGACGTRGRAAVSPKDEQGSKVSH
jgi:hypothetical protein